MYQLDEIYSPVRIPEDYSVLAGLKKYNWDHNGQQVKTALGKLWPLSFHINTVSTVNSILFYFNDSQREEYIDSIIDSFPPCSSIEWRDFLAYCTEAQITQLLEKLSTESCTDLYGEHGFFVMLVAKAEDFSLPKLKLILTHLRLHFPNIIDANYDLESLRFIGGSGQDQINKIRLILQYIQPDLYRIKLTTDMITKCFSSNIGMIYSNKPQWTAVVKTYFKGFAQRLPYIFYSAQQVQAFYTQQGVENERTQYTNNNTIRLTFSPELIKKEFDQSIQDCLSHFPNLYSLVSKYNGAADLCMGLLIQYAIDAPAVSDIDTDPLHIEFQNFIKHALISTPQTSYAYVTQFIFKYSAENQLIDNLSTLNPHWLSVLNAHVDQLNWDSSFNKQQTRDCFRTYINSIKSSRPCHITPPPRNHVFFLQTLSALALSATLLGIGLLLILSSLHTAVGSSFILSGAILGFFAYKARNESTFPGLNLAPSYQ